MMAVAPGQGIIAHRHADGRLAGYVALNRPEAWNRGNGSFDPNAGLARFAGAFDGWAPPLTALITHSDAEPIVRPIHALPIGLEWARSAGVTLLGDAAHLMSPFAGEGANLAMADGAALGAALLAGSDPETALARYEADLFARATPVARASAANLARFFDA